VVEQLGVASPVDGSLKLSNGFFFGEMFVQDIVEKVVGQSVVGLRLQRALDLLQERDMFERGVAKQLLLAQDKGIGKLQPLGSDLDVALGQLDKSEQGRRFDDGQQIVDLELQQVG